MLPQYFKFYRWTLTSSLQMIIKVVMFLINKLKKMVNCEGKTINIFSRMRTETWTTRSPCFLARLKKNWRIKHLGRCAKLNSLSEVHEMVESYFFGLAIRVSIATCIQSLAGLYMHSLYLVTHCLKACK